MKKKNPRDEREQVNVNEDTVIRIPIKLGIWNAFRGICALENKNSKKTYEELVTQFIKDWREKNNLKG